MVNNREKNQAKILKWIKDDFSLTLSDSRTFDNAVEIEQIPSGSDYITDFDQIFRAIRDYIKAHLNDFYLGELVHSNLDEAEAKKQVKRP